MGLIKSIFGGIFSLIGGIFGGIAKVFGVGKKSEFYLELDEANAPAPAEVAGSRNPEVATDTSVVAAVAQAEVAEVKPAPAATKKSKKAKAAPAAAIAPEAAPVAPTPAPAEPAITNFATDYLVNAQFNRAPRRRPGPSVSPFKQMAREMSRKSPSMG